LSRPIFGGATVGQPTGISNQSTNQSLFQAEADRTRKRCTVYWA